MAKIVKSLLLDVSRRNRIQAIVAKQHDKDSRFLKIQILDEGEPIVIDQSSVVTINASRADNTSKAFAGEVNGDGTVTVPITYWMLELDDKVSCDVSIIDTQGRKLSTLNFTIEVEHSNYSGDDISEDENYDLLVTLITEVAEAKDAEAKRVVAENARVVAEQARVTAENTRASAESTRTTNETARQTAEEGRVAAEQARKQELNNKLDKSDIVQTTGQNTNAVMSQKAVTAEINALKSHITDLQTALIGVSDLIGGDA